MTIEGFGNINVSLNKAYDKGHVKRLLDYLGFAFEKWEDSVVKLEKLRDIAYKKELSKYKKDTGDNTNDKTEYNESK